MTFLVRLLFGCLALLLATAFHPFSLKAQPASQSESVGKYLDQEGQLRIPASFTGNLDPKGYRMVVDGNGEPRFVSSVLAVAGDEKWDDRFGYPGANGAGVYAMAVAPNGDIYFGGQIGSIGSLDNVGRIARYTPATRHWSRLGSGFDTGSLVYAIAISGDDIYVGGYFRKAGGVDALRIAVWKNSLSSWLNLGAGISGEDSTVFSLAVSGGYLYAGGSFTRADGVPVNGIARMSLFSSNWSDVGGGVTGGAKPGVFALAPYGTGVLVGGRFTTGGLVTAANVAIWDGTSWRAVGQGVNATVRAVAVGTGGTFYVGGLFNRAINQDGSTVVTGSVASFNGAWSNLGGGLTGGLGSVLSLAYVNGSLYVGGAFTTGGGALAASNIAKFNGVGWFALGSGTDANASGVWALAYDGKLLYVGGDFFVAGPLRPKGAAAWNEVKSTWESLGWGIQSGSVKAVLVDNNDVYVGGSFDEPGGYTGFKSIARWDRINHGWFPLGTGITGSVLALAKYNGKIWVGGTFNTAGGLPVLHLATWDPVTLTWADPGANISDAALNPAVRALTVYAGALHVGGSFTSIGGLQTPGIAGWTPGGGWFALGNGISGQVRTMAAGSDGLYVGGFFTMDIPSSFNPYRATNIVRWDTFNWTTLTRNSDAGAFTDNGAAVNVIIAAGGNLIVGGRGTIMVSGSTPTTAHNIGLWTGSGWEEIAGGISSDVQSLAIVDGSLLAGGQFVLAGRDTAYGIASTDGTTWVRLGSGTTAPASAVGGTVNALAQKDSIVYVGGAFNSAGGKVALNFTQWGVTRPGVSGWTLLPSGLTGRLSSLDFKLDPVGYVAGSFGFAGKTTDRGTTWATLTTKTSVDFNKIRTVGVTNLFVAGGGGTLLRSTDAGTTFSPISLGTTENLLGFDMAPDNLHGAVVGTNSFIAVTTDGGNAWRTITPPVNATYNSAAVLNASVYFAVGQKGIILKSTDGGTTWNQVSSGTTRNLSTIFFWDASNGIIGGDNGMILRTTNGGASFTIMRSGTLLNLHGGGYLDMNTIALCGDGGLVLLSTDAGLNYFVDENAHYGSLWDMSIARNVLHKTAGVVNAAYVVGDNDVLLAKTIAPTGVREAGATGPDVFSLSQNYPNPFNPTTVISYQLPVASTVKLVVYDLLGREVMNLVDEKESSGSHTARFNGSGLASGVYFYRLTAGDFVQTRKLVLMK